MQSLGHDLFRIAWHKALHSLSMNNSAHYTLVQTEWRKKRTRNGEKCEEMYTISAELMRKQIGINGGVWLAKRWTCWVINWLQEIRWANEQNNSLAIECISRMKSEIHFLEGCMFWKDACFGNDTLLERMHFLPSWKNIFFSWIHFFVGHIS